MKRLGEPLDRRSLLQWTGRVLIGAGGWSLASACARAPAEPPTLSVSLDQLPPGGRVVIGDEEIQVEVRRNADGVVARSLVCPHIGCFVEWKESESVYVCPCHQGTFDAFGQLMHGPPRGSLTDLPARIEGNRVIVNLPGEESAS